MDCSLSRCATTSATLMSGAAAGTGGSANAGAEAVRVAAAATTSARARFMAGGSLSCGRRSRQRFNWARNATTGTAGSGHEWPLGACSRTTCRCRNGWSALDAGAGTADERLDLLEVRHRGVAGRRHRQRAVRRAVLHRHRQVALLDQAVDQPGREAVAAAHPVEDLQARTVRRLDEA